MRMLLFAESKRFRNLNRAIAINPQNRMALYRLSLLYLENNLYFDAMDKADLMLGREAEDPRLMRQQDRGLSWIQL